MEAIEKGVPHEAAESIGKAVHELVLNAIEWGGHFDPTRQVRISCVRTPRLILSRIADPGLGSSLTLSAMQR
jgi:anti-sigma regulatory factor (Ser/Thr protein kinase)